MAAVTEKDVAKLHAYLVVPIAVADAMMAGTPLEEDTQYGLHVALSEIEPDSALLAIALSAQRIASEFRMIIPMASALKIESDSIIAEYGPEWLANYHRHPMQGADLFDLLCHVPEDLESLADLLLTLQALLPDPDHPAYTLCSILAIQARAHMEIADYVLTELENDIATGGWERLSPTRDDFGINAPLTKTAGDNIILFPIHRRR